MIQRRRKPRRSRQQRIGFESLESRQVLTAAFVDVDPGMWAWDAGAAAESADIWAESWVASDGWYDESWWGDDSSWVDDNWWNDEGSWSNDDGWVTASWSSDDAAVGIDVATAVVDGVVDNDTGLQTSITVDADSTVIGGDGDGGWSAFAPEVIPVPEAASALETSGVSLEPQDVLSEVFTTAEPFFELVDEVLWGTVSEGLTDVTVTAEASAGDQNGAVIDASSYEFILRSDDSTPAVLDDAAVAEFDEPLAVFDEPLAVFDEPLAVLDEPVAVFDEPVAVFDEPVAVFDEPVAVFDEPVAVFDEPVAVFDEPVAVFDEPVAVFDEPVAVFDEPVAVFDEPVAVFDEPVAVLDEPVAVFDEPVAVFDEPVAVLDEPVAVLDEPVAVLDEPVAVLDEPVAVLDEPVAVLDEPVAVLDEPVAVLDEPVAVVDVPVAVVAPITVPPRPPVAKTQGLAGRSTSWFGMFMQGFGGFSASSDAASLSDSEIPGRGRLRGRLPFRPAN